ncbi:MFS transporter [Oricola sp.]|uniref:MFS transporter n=1 Tax=Oricola sp. TaxID=1979950 RepID=UPI003BABD150
MPMLRFLLDNARWLLGGLLLTMFSSFGQTFFISLSAGELRAEYGLSHGGFGALYMLATLASALTLPQLGKIVDRYSIVQVVGLTIPMLAVACMAMALSHSLWMLVVVIYLLRLFGQGMMTHIAMTAMGKWYAAQRGRAVSVAGIGINFGEALFPLIFVAILGAVGWRGSWLVAAATLLVVALPAIYLLMRVERQPRGVAVAADPSGVRDWTRAEVLRDPLFYLLMTGILAPPFIGTTIFFHQVYLVELRGWSQEAFAASFIFMSSMTVVCAIICGGLVDRFSAVRILPFFLLPLAAACFALFAIESQISAFVFMTLLGVSYGFSGTLFGAVWPEIYGAKHLGAIRSGIVAVMVLATAVGPGLTGLLIDLGVSYSGQIFTFGVYCLFACAALYVGSLRLIARAASPVAIEEAPG